MSKKSLAGRPTGEQSLVIAKHRKIMM